MAYIAEVHPKLGRRGRCGAVRGPQGEEFCLLSNPGVYQPAADAKAGSSGMV